MIIDLRYHVASLVAIFLALGVGIFIGSTVVGETLVAEIIQRQEGIVNKLEFDYENLKNEAKVTQQELLSLKSLQDYYERYAHETAPYLISERLQNKRIVLLFLGEQKLPDVFINNLRAAGAEILSVTSFSDNLLQLDKIQIEELALFLACGKNEKEVKKNLFKKFTSLLISGDNINLLRRMEEMKLSKSWGTFGQADIMILVQGNIPPKWTNAAREIENLLINSAKEEKVVIQQVLNDNSTVLSLQNQLDITMGKPINISTIPGQIALIIGLSEKHKVQASQPTTKLWMPPLLEGEIDE